MTGFLCFLLFIIGAALAIFSGLSKGHGRGIEVTGHLLISLCFFLYGLISSHILQTAPRPVVVGQIVAVNPARSRMDLNYTTIQPGNGGPNLKLHSEFVGPAIAVGERVRVRYSDYDNGVLELDVLSGPGQGFVLHENDSAFYHVLFVLGGFIFLATAYLAGRRRTPKPASA